MTKTMPENGITSPATTETYAASYSKLAAIAERLRSGIGVSVDMLVEDVRAARAAHEVCRARLDAVRREIDAEIAAADAVAGEAGQARGA